LAKTDCGLKENSLILLEQVQTIDQYRLRDLIGTLDKEKMKEVDKALSISVGLAK
jgi:mRNA interferase MazF